ncbi:MAG: metalloregulator ArsR/SmtB family transcription factor, partial [Acidobacteriota bacterium]
FQALCDPIRLNLVVRLAGAEALTVGEATGCCNVHLSGVSRHLAILKRAGVVEAEKRGREVYYRLRSAELARSLRAIAAALDASREALAHA